MNSAETIERVPIHTDADGVVRVAGTRVTLDTIVAAFDAGATAEEILEGYPTLDKEKIAAAPLYMRAFPRRGRPSRDPCTADVILLHAFHWTPNLSFQCQPEYPDTYAATIVRIFGIGNHRICVLRD